MSTRLGLGLRSGAVSAALVEDARLRWSTRASIEGADGFDRAVRKVLDEAASEFGNVPLRVAVGPWASRIKRFEDGFAGLDRGSLDRMLADNPGAFFLKNGVPLRTSGLIDDRHGPTAAAFHESVLATVATAARDCGTAVEFFVPTPVALLQASDADEIAWRDGPLEQRIIRIGTGAPAVRTRFVREAASAGSPPFGGGTDTDKAWAVADAFGAAVTEPGAPLVLTPNSRGGSGRATRALLGLAFSLLLIGLAAPAGTALAARQAERRIEEARGPHWPRVLQVRDDLSHTTRRIARTAEFLARPAITPLLAELSLRLPAGGAVTTLEMADASTARVQVLGRSAADLAARIEESPLVARAIIEGTIERREAGNQSLEEARLTLRLEDAGRWDVRNDPD